MEKFVCSKPANCESMLRRTSIRPPATPKIRRTEMCVWFFIGISIVFSFQLLYVTERTEVVAPKAYPASSSFQWWNQITKRLFHHRNSRRKKMISMEYHLMKTEVEMGSNYYMGWLISASVLAALCLYMAFWKTWKASDHAPESNWEAIEAPSKIQFMGSLQQAQAHTCIATQN